MMIVAFYLSVCVACSSHAGEVLVHNADELEAAMESAQPGDTVVMADGVWTDAELVFAGKGIEESPITLRPQTPGGVTLTGSRLSISGDWLVAYGLHFKQGQPTEIDHVVQFRGPLGDATNCRLTNTQISHYNPEDPATRYFWVSLYGQNNRVDHCRFVGQNHSGVTVVAWLDGSEARHRIDHNHFLDRPPGDGNGFETLRLGTSEFHDTNAHIVVEHNLFERIDGEMEIISNKCNDNVFRYNTFSESQGTLTLRHGHRATVDGNFFLGRGKDRTGGVRVIGEDHVVTNNYFAGLDDRADGAISLTAAIENTPANGYQHVKNALIAHNTIVDVRGAAITLDWGYGERNRTLLPQGVKIIGNLIQSEHAPLFEGQEGEGWTWQNNIAYGSELGISARQGIAQTDPLLVQDDTGLWRPDPASPAIDGGSSAATIGHDMDGQARADACDIGADERSDEPITRGPLTPADVGPSWANTPQKVDQPSASVTAPTR